jgi:multicomponent Na+:H+ antiporter subunit G
MAYAAGVLMLIGALFSALAALGMLRFPDIYTRLHAASKAGPVGAGLILLGVAVASGDVGIALRALLGLAFLITTAPLSAHLLARAALRGGTTPDVTTVVNEYDSTH